ncbi:MAG: hydroxypyruvate isomerase family protein [Terracidiphilus sp.]|nr:hydroxypyruvate isomerase family protein [Terracidiphilus sp.]
MPRFAANLTMMYAEHNFLDRFAAAASDGFTAVEYLFPYEHSAKTLAALLKEHGLTQVLFNSPAGDWKAGERGLTALPGREREFREGFLRALEYARAMECPRIHTMAGIAPAGSDRALMHETFVANLAWAAGLAAKEGMDVLIEPIAQRNMPGFFLNFQEEAHAIATATGCSNVKILMDLFHCQVAEGDLAIKIRKYIQDPKQTRVGHFQIAGVPERHEPDTGEVRYDYLFELIDEVGFDGWIGCEYVPAGGISEGLGWFKKYASA